MRLERRVREAVELVEREGFTIVNVVVAKHTKIYVERRGCTRMIVTSASPSDNKTGAALRALARRMAREIDQMAA